MSRLSKENLCLEACSPGLGAGLTVYTFVNIRGKTTNFSGAELVFTARRYASAVLAVIVCLSVCLSVRWSVCHKSELYKDG